MPKDLTPAQAELVAKMTAGKELKLTAAGEFLLIAPAGGFTSTVLRATVQALERAGVVRNTKKADRHGHQLYELAERQEAVSRKPSRWPFMVSAHNWSKP